MRYSKRFVALAIIVFAFSLAPAVGAPAAAQDLHEPDLAGEVEEVDRYTRTVVVEAVRVYVPQDLLVFSDLVPGLPVIVDLDPRSEAPRAVRIEVVPD